MIFTNSTISLAEIPHIVEAKLSPVHSHYLKVLRIEWLIFSTVLFLAVAIILIFNTGALKYWWLFSSFSIFSVGLYKWILEKSFPYRAFAIREKDVVFQKGWIVRSIQVCPYNRIQNTTVYSGPISRRFGLASLIFYTAGTNMADMRIHGLQREDAQRIRSFILEKIKLEGEQD